MKQAGRAGNPPLLFSMKWIAILFTLFILLVIVLADAGRLGILAFVNRVPYGDKAGHFILYGILTLLFDLTLIQARPHHIPKRIILMVGLTLALLIGLEEFSQQYFPNRTFSLIDLAFSYFGVIIFSWLALRSKK